MRLPGQGRLSRAKEQEEMPRVAVREFDKHFSVHVEAQGSLAINFLNPHLFLQGHYPGNFVQLWIKRLSSETALICRLWSHDVSAGEWGWVTASGRLACRTSALTSGFAEPGHKPVTFLIFIIATERMEDISFSRLYLGNPGKRPG